MTGMLKDITFGQYFQSNSLIHRLDPRTKILLLIADIVFLFLTKSLWALLIPVTQVALVMLLSKVPVRMFAKNIKTILLLRDSILTYLDTMI